MKSYYDRVCAVATAHGISMRRLAREAGISESTISRWKSRGSTPYPATRFSVIRAMTALTGQPAPIVVRQLGEEDWVAAYSQLWHNQGIR